jgi:exodeoxyribonuclease-3
MSNTLLSKLQTVNVLSWNVNGMRSFLRHNNDNNILEILLKRRKVDILCLQETKLQQMHVVDVESELNSILKSLDYHSPRCYWFCSTARKGYSGTATILLNDNIDVTSVKYGSDCSEADPEGRVISIETPQFALVNAYVPNSGDGLKRLDFRINQWDTSYRRHIDSLRQDHHNGRPLILTGDFNVAHTELDYFNYNDPRSRKVAGTTIEEQKSFHSQILSGGFIDTFRAIFPNERTYSYFSARKGDIGRASNEGWRLDYVLTDTLYISSNIKSLPYIDHQVYNYMNIYLYIIIYIYI